MHVISVVSSKGGVGKTTLTSALAVRACRDSKRVAMVDLDPQASLAAWWARRGKTENPSIFTQADTAGEAVDKLSRHGWDWVFIDTPPAFVNLIQDVVLHSTLAIIPLRASALDLIASEDAVLMAREGNIPHLCVINDAEPRWKSTEQARLYLERGKVPVAKTIITHRAAYLTAMASGKTGFEVDRTDNTKTEIDGLWAEIENLLATIKEPVRHA